MNLNEISKGIFKSEHQKDAIKILNYLMDHEKIINYLTIILQLYLRLDAKQNMEKDPKY